MYDFLTVEQLSRLLSVVMATALIAIVVSQALAVWQSRSTLWAALLETNKCGKANLARFQFLLCLMVLLPLFLVLSLETGQFIEIPAGVQVVFAISAGAYVLAEAVAAFAAKRADGGSRES